MNTRNTKSEPKNQEQIYARCNEKVKCVQRASRNCKDSGCCFTTCYQYQDLCYICFCDAFVTSVGTILIFCVSQISLVCSYHPQNKQFSGSKNHSLHHWSSRFLDIYMVVHCQIILKVQLYHCETFEGEHLVQITWWYVVAGVLRRAFSHNHTVVGWTQFFRLG